MRYLLPIVSMVLLAGCSSPGAPDSQGPSQTGASGMKMVSMVDNSFKDGNFERAPGGQAMYMNEGQSAHTVSIHLVGEPATTLKVDKTLQPGQTETYTFATAGTYHVFCKIHGTMTSGMTSTVAVA
ncbi:MAG: plastocyanin/azurin family copper-binding protein [Thermoplasmatota archaeon]